MASRARTIRYGLRELCLRGAAAAAHGLRSIGPSVAVEVVPCTGRVAISAFRCETPAPVAATVYAPGASPVMPTARPPRSVLSDPPAAEKTVARVVPGSESIASAPSSPTDVQLLAQRSRLRARIGKAGSCVRFDLAGSKASTAMR